MSETSLEDRVQQLEAKLMSHQVALVIIMSAVDNAARMSLNAQAGNFDDALDKVKLIDEAKVFVKKLVDFDEVQAAVNSLNDQSLNGDEGGQSDE